MLASVGAAFRFIGIQLKFFRALAVVALTSSFRNSKFMTMTKPDGAKVPE